LPSTIKSSKPFQGRIARRVVALFLLSALIPLALCAAFLFHGFNAELTHTRTQSLDGLLRNFGTTLLGRLESADDMLRLATAHGETARANVAKLAWVRSVHKSERSEQPKKDLQLPKPDSGQERALRRGDTIVLTDRDKDGAPAVYLVRALSSSTWLYAEIDPAWLWADVAGFAGETSLLLLDPQGEVLGSTGHLPSELIRTSVLDVRQHLPVDQSRGTSDHWTSRSWEMLLANRYSSPSWRLVAIGPSPTLLHSLDSSTLVLLCACIVLTLVLIALLSLVCIRKQLGPLQLLAQATHQVAQHDFEAFRSMSWHDEFGDLARSLDSMSQKLKTQFAAQEAFAEVDRILLSHPELQSVFNTLLPRATGLLGCDAVSVVLFDPESAGDGQAYAYEHYASVPDRCEVRALFSGIASLRSASNFPAVQVIRNNQQLYFSPDAPHPIVTVRTFPLKNDGIAVGLFCLGHKSEQLDRPDSGVSAADFAERLALILAGLARAENARRQAHYDSLMGPVQPRRRGGPHSNGRSGLN
jgi:HAMP domain-containing protein